ncbi:unnamed protein product [Pleuronectes platessa]|uniref:Uncharacterized protein n=1 Tax=Pleuronectes platessa TaxID=8262 RepID=A0A9N7Y028_PLEPL|nr:unnamed protein product [Pleuronectes platessa]
MFNQRSRSGKTPLSAFSERLHAPTLIPGEKITLPGASSKRSASWKNHCHRLTASKRLQSCRVSTQPETCGPVRTRTPSRSCDDTATGILEPEEEECFRQEPGVVSTFPVTLPRREKIPAAAGKAGRR